MTNRQSVSTAAAKPARYGDDRRKHLGFVQANVTRMSAASTTTKSWLLPVVTAAFGYALTHQADSVAFLGIMSVVLFGLLDANYLRQEKAYRNLYNAVARRPGDIPLFSMDPRDAEQEGTPATSRWGKLRLSVAQWVPPRQVWFSWSIAPFYGPLLIAGVAVFFRAR